MKRLLPRHIAMLAALVIAAWLALFGDKTPDQQGNAAAMAVPVTARATQAAQTAQTAKAARSSKARAERDIPILALLPRSELISAGHTDLAGVPRNDAQPLFASHSWVTQVQGDSKPPEPPAPVAPPLRFKYLGRKVEDGVWQVFLALNDNTYIAGVQTVIDNKYRVDVINPNFVMLTYLPLNQQQRLNTRGQD